MSIYFNQLQATLSQLKPIYLLAGDDPFLQQKARESIKAAGKKQGFEQTVQLHVTSQFPTHELHNELESMGLFSSKSFIELFNPKAKFDKTALALLENYLGHPNPDKVLTIITDKLSAAQKRSAWFKLIDQSGLVVQIYPIPMHQLPAWIQQQSKNLGLSLDVQVTNLIATATEGNLLATHQLLEKIRLTYDQQPVDIKKLGTLLSDGAQFSVFDLIDSLMLADFRKSYRILRYLKESGLEPTLILWGLTKFVNELLELKHQQAQGESLSALINKQWKSKQALYRKALSYYQPTVLENVVSQLHPIDLAIKGLSYCDSWQQLSQALMLLAAPAVKGKPS